MTFPALRGPWDFPCQLIGEDGQDRIRAVGIDTSRVTWIRLVVPQPLAGELANRWIGNTGYIEVPETRATELLRSGEAWRSLNPEAVSTLTPDLVPAPEQGVDPETMGQARLREASELRGRIAACLRADPTQSNRGIARLIAPLNKKLVIHVRRQLEASGEIEHVPPSARKMGRPGRPRREKAPQ